MKKGLIKTALIVGVCAVVGAVCFAGACGGTDDDNFDEREPQASDLTYFKDAVSSSLNYTGAYTMEVSVTPPGDTDAEVTTIAFDPVAARTAYTESSVTAESHYYVKDSDGTITKYVYNGLGSFYGSSTSTDGTYDHYAFSYVASQFVGDPSSISSAEDAESYIAGIVYTVSKTQFGTDELALTVKAEDGTRTYTITGSTTDSSYTYNITFVADFTDSKLADVSVAMDLTSGSGDTASTQTMYVGIDIKYSVDSSIWPEELDAAEED
ncbi:MAG: hypothetical protein LUD48_00765 [Prevotella sp.]|nr:hypothetical protein [Prevotella sp.]